MRLLDVNLLLYAVNETTVQHERARMFVDTVMQDEEEVALPWAVVLGFLRISTNARIHAQPLSIDEAVAVVDGWLSRPNVRLLAPGDAHWSVLRSLLVERGAVGNGVPDAHLAAMAIERDAVLYSSDADFGRFPQLRWSNPLTAREA